MAGLPQEGQSFGRYRIVRRIGRGGMGVVYAAVQEGLGREVALKVLSSELADDDDYRNRFLREAEVLARLESPHIIAVHDAGEQDGWLYIATQLVPDGDLHELLASAGALPEKDALELVAQVAEGIATAHAAGIIHRDIKPSNVLLRRRPDGSLQAYVCDLGISRTLDAQHTRTQGVIGTFTYMAPERHEGHDATAASDVYALGCLLWAAITGHAPYVGTDSQVLMGHLSGPMPQLHRGEALADRIDQLLRWSMAKDPGARLASARDFAAHCSEIAALADADQAGPRTQGTATPGTATQGTATQGTATPAFPPPSDWHPTSHLPVTTQPAAAPNRTAWLVAGLALLVLIVGSVIVGVIATRGDDRDDTSADGGDDRTSSSAQPATDGEDEPVDMSEVPTNTTVQSHCTLYSIDLDENDPFELYLDYADAMRKVGTPEAIPADAREGFLIEIQAVESSGSVDEFHANAANLSAEDTAKVNAYEEWATATCG